MQDIVAYVRDFTSSMWAAKTITRVSIANMCAVVATEQDAAASMQTVTSTTWDVAASKPNHKRRKQR